MADAPANLGFVPVRLWETTDPVLGGGPEAPDNIPINQLASRDQALLAQIEELQSALAAQINGGRLSIRADNPTPNEFRGNSQTVFWLPYASTKVSLWTGTRWDIYDIPLAGLALDTQSWPAPQTRDVFVYFDALTETLNLETRVWGNPNLIANRGYTIESFQGVDVLATDRSRRFLGCIYRSAQSTLAQAGIHDDANIVDLWNRDNQIVKALSFSTTSDPYPVNHTASRITKAAFQFDFFRVVSGDPRQIYRMDGLLQRVNGNAAGAQDFLNARFTGYNDRASAATEAGVFSVNQATASASHGNVMTSAYQRNRGAQTFYLVDFRSAAAGATVNPIIQIAIANAEIRY